MKHAVATSKLLNSRLLYNEETATQQKADKNEEIANTQFFGEEQESPLAEYLENGLLCDTHTNTKTQTHRESHTYIYKHFNIFNKN